MSFRFFAGIDWGSEKHNVCLLDSEGKQLWEASFPHSGEGLSQFAAELIGRAPGERSQIAVAIEVPRGAIVETLLGQGLTVFSINPKQLDRFRDRFSMAGAKDDSRDARVLADSLRTDQHCFRSVQVDDPAIIRIRELSRIYDRLQSEFQAVANQLWEQLRRFYPALLELCPGADEPWLWEVLERVQLPARAGKITPANIRAILTRHSIRRLQADEVVGVLRQPPLGLAPGSAEAASEHALLLTPRLTLLHDQMTETRRRMKQVLEQLSAPGPAEGETLEHRDAHILRSLPGVGVVVAATMLAEASQLLAQRDYHGLRAHAGTAPVTRQSGKRKVVSFRRSCNPRLRQALFFCARVIARDDHTFHAYYESLRAAGHSYARALRSVADRALRVLIAMLKTRTLFDPSKNLPASSASSANLVDLAISC